jgi:hypothetical protein
MIDFHYVMPGLITFLAFWGALWLGPKESGWSQRGMFLLPWAMVALMAVLSLYPYGSFRQDIFLAVCLFGLAGGAFSQLFGYDRRLYAFVLSFLIVFGLTHNLDVMDDWQNKEDMRTLVAVLCDQINAEEVVYVHNDATPAFEYYWPDCPLSEEANFNLAGDHSQVLLRASPQELQAHPSRDAWLVTSHLNSNQTKQVLDAIVEHTARAKKQVYTDVAVGLYYFPAVAEP